MDSILQERLDKLRNDKNEVIVKISDPEVLKNQKDYEALVRDLKEIDR